MHDLKRDTVFCFWSEQTHEMKNIIMLWNCNTILQSACKKFSKTCISGQVNVENSQILDMLEQILFTIQNTVFKQKTAEDLRQMIRYYNMEKQT